MLYLSGKVKKFDLISVTLVVATIIISITLIKSYYEDEIRILKSESVLYKDTLDRLKTKISMPRYKFATNYEKMDYHNYEFMQLEALREGPGENGEKHLLSEPDDIEKNREMFKQFGFFVGASDRISVNRSLPDVRLESCKTKQYIKQLPKVSIVIAFYNEYLSILLRTLHSIYNRTPHELLHEIVLINDNSTIAELYEPLSSHVKENFHGLVSIFSMPTRSGLVMSRMRGGRLSTGEVLVFLDAQVEVNVNWLPPLLEPIALNPRLLTTPIIDNIAFDTFEYKKSDDGGRSLFNWDLQYRRFPRRAEDSLKLDEPIASPVMVGSAFAVNRQHFWDLGGYDEGLKAFQGEQLELSLKAHLCGVGMVECPCSRVGHSFRSKNYYRRYGDDGEDYMFKNFKRIAEVWFDEYKSFVYQRDRAKFADADAGDLTRAKARHRGLHCKPFRYFIEFVAPDMLDYYPIEDPGYFAKGAIQSKARPQLCIEVPKHGKRMQIEVKECVKDLIKPHPKQFFKLAWHRNIQHFTYDFCLEDDLTMAECHFAGGNQYWKYDLITSQISQPTAHGIECLTLNSEDMKIFLQVCDSQKTNQKWNWGDKNVSALQNWESFGIDFSKIKLEAPTSGKREAKSMPVGRNVLPIQPSEDVKVETERNLEIMEKLQAQRKEKLELDNQQNPEAKLEAENILTPQPEIVQQSDPQTNLKDASE